MSANAHSGQPIPAVRFWVAPFAIFCLFTALTISAGYSFPALPFQQNVVLVANTIIFAATSCSLYFFNRSLSQRKPYALVKYVYLGIFSKFACCLLPAMIYILQAGKSVDKVGLAIGAFLYIAYTYIELRLIIKPKQRSKHAETGSTT